MRPSRRPYHRPAGSRWPRSRARSGSRSWSTLARLPHASRLPFATWWGATFLGCRRAVEARRGSAAAALGARLQHRDAGPELVDVARVGVAHSHILKALDAFAGSAELLGRVCDLPADGAFRTELLHFAVVGERLFIVALEELRVAAPPPEVPIVAIALDQLAGLGDGGVIFGQALVGLVGEPARARARAMASADSMQDTCTT